MASFLDKLLSPSVRRDIGAMGIRGDIENFNEAALLNKVEQWYNDFDIAQLKDWDELSGSMKNQIKDFAIGEKSIEDLDIDEQMGFAEELTGISGIASYPAFASVLSSALNSFDASNYGGPATPSQITSPESFGGIGFNPLSRESILENLPNVGEKYREGTYEGNAENLLESVKPLTMDQIRKTTTGFYNPYIEKEKKPLVDRLIDKRKTATALGGDFAGYGQREQYQDIAEGSFMSGVENIYSDVDAARAGALDDLYGTIASWQDVGEIS
jgi:hypothetical protein